LDELRGVVCFEEGLSLERIEILTAEVQERLEVHQTLLGLTLKEKRPDGRATEPLIVGDNRHLDIKTPHKWQ